MRRATSIPGPVPCQSKNQGTGSGNEAGDVEMFTSVVIGQTRKTRVVFLESSPKKKVIYFCEFEVRFLFPLNSVCSFTEDQCQGREERELVLFGASARMEIRKCCCDH